VALSATSARAAVKADINVTPLIDVLLVLLIIFMITLPLSRRDFEAQVPPEQQSKTKSPPSSQIVLELMADGTYQINRQPYTHDQLLSAMHQIFDPRPVKLLFVKSAPNRKYRELIDAMDIARGAGVQVLGLTPPEPTKAP